MSKFPVCDDNNELMYNKKYVEVKWYSAAEFQLQQHISGEHLACAQLGSPDSSDLNLHPCLRTCS